MDQHPMAGRPVKITTGKLKGRYFIVIDWLVRQFQGKAIEKIHKGHRALTGPVIGRGFNLDNNFVFGRIYPEMHFICVHDEELHTAEPAELSGPNVVSLAAKREQKQQIEKLVHGEEYDTGRSSERNNNSTEPGEPGTTNGRSVSSANGNGEAQGEIKSKGQADSPTGSTVRRSSTGKAGSDKREAKKGAGASSETRGEGSK